MGKERRKTENANGQSFLGKLLQGANDTEEVELVAFAGQTQAVSGSVDGGIATQKLIGIGRAQGNDRLGFVAQKQIIAGAVRGVPAVVPENVAHHALGGD